jgi:hypothetical protein
MNRAFKQPIFLGLLTLVLLASCKKYPEGPAFSFLSKKGRAVNGWAIEQYLEDGVDKTDAYLAGYSDFSLQLLKDGTYLRSWVSLSAPFTEAGAWEFADGKNELVMVSASGSTAPVEYTILKLQNHKMWLRIIDPNSTVEKEIHYKKRK